MKVHENIIEELTKRKHAISTRKVSRLIGVGTTDTYYFLQALVKEGKVVCEGIPGHSKWRINK